MLCALAAVLLVFHFSVAERGTGWEHFHVRGLDEWAMESIERGHMGSPTVRALVRDLAASDLIVHVGTSTTLPHGVGGMTQLVFDAGKYRYARITLDRNLTPDPRAAMLAHELQHALELARSEARTDEAVLDLYRRIGHRVGGQRPSYDTLAAQRAGARAGAELQGYTATAVPHR